MIAPVLTLLGVGLVGLVGREGSSLRVGFEYCQTSLFTAFSLMRNSHSSQSEGLSRMTDDLIGEPKSYEVDIIASVAEMTR